MKFRVLTIQPFPVTYYNCNFTHIIAYIYDLSPTLTPTLTYTISSKLLDTNISLYGLQRADGENY